jgi:hypothetical protein
MPRDGAKALEAPFVSADPNAPNTPLATASSRRMICRAFVKDAWERKPCAR